MFLILDSSECEVPVRTCFRTNILYALLSYTEMKLHKRSTWCLVYEYAENFKAK